MKIFLFFPPTFVDFSKHRLGDFLRSKPFCDLFIGGLGRRDSETREVEISDEWGGETGGGT